MLLFLVSTTGWESRVAWGSRSKNTAGSSARPTGHEVELARQRRKLRTLQPENTIPRPRCVCGERTEFGTDWIGRTVPITCPNCTRNDFRGRQGLAPVVLRDLRPLERKYRSGPRPNPHTSGGAATKTGGLQGGRRGA